MKRTLHKRAGLWELSIPLRAPVRGIWRYGAFAEAWGYLWRTGYPPGLPGEIKMAVRQPEPTPLGIDYLAAVDDAVHDAFDATNGLLAGRISLPHPIAAAPSEVKRRFSGSLEVSGGSRERSCQSPTAGARFRSACERGACTSTVTVEGASDCGWFGLRPDDFFDPILASQPRRPGVKNDRAKFGSAASGDHRG